MRRIIYVQLLLLISISTFSQLKVAGIFGNNAIIQQGIAAPIWGKASPNAIVEIVFAGQELKTKADEDGNWMIRLIPMKADGKSHELIIKSKTEKQEYNNVQLGEVWFASGQSNMEWKVSNGIINQDEEIAKADYPNIRFYTVKAFASATPINDIPQKDWEICTPNTVKGFSAVSYFFARELHLDKKVPVGIIVSARGATSLETWMSREKLMTHPDFTEEVSKMDSATWNNKVRKCIQAEKDRENIANNSLVGISQKVNSLEFNDSAWNTTEYPLNMPKMNYLRFWGIVWVRKTFEVSSDALNTELKLYLPIVDQNDRIYLNGKEIARGVSQLKQKVISIPAGTLKIGKNVLAIRMYINWGSGEIGNEITECYLKSNEGVRIELNGKWKHNNKIEPPVAQWQDYYNSNTVSFNGMVNPVIPYGIKGFLWYQGENNAGRFKQYSELQPMLIDDWRVRWGQGYLPFLFVQLAAYRERSATPKQEDEWTNFRDAQSTTLLRSPNTAMACAIDIGETNNIHPKSKQDVGKRLYMAAKTKAYGSTEVYSGPMFKSAKLEGNSVRISFIYAQNGLKTKGDVSVKGFAVAGIDGKWVWADAKIDGKDIIVSSTEIIVPTQVQYAWQSNPDCNLYNAENLPVLPFKAKIDK